MFVLQQIVIRCTTIQFY